MGNTTKAQEVGAEIAAKRPQDGPFGVEGILRRIVRDARASRRYIWMDDDDIIQDVYAELCRPGNQYDPSKAGLGAYAGRIAWHRVNREGQRRDALRYAVPLTFEDHGSHVRDADERLESPNPGPIELSRESEIRTAWLELVSRLEELGRTFDIEVLRAVVAHDGNHSAAAAELSQRYPRPIPAETVKRIMARIRTYAPARRLARLNEESEE